MVVTNRQEIADLVLRFREVLCSKLQQEVCAVVGYKGGGMSLALHWSDDVQMWMAYVWWWMASWFRAGRVATIPDRRR
jgi:hypothetical protein